MGKGERQKVVIIGFDPGIQKKLDYPIKRLCRNTFLLSSSPPTKTLEDKLQRETRTCCFYWIPACAGMTKKSKKAITTQSPSRVMTPRCRTSNFIYHGLLVTSDKK
ncbi:MAG: hypothetical protein COS89_02035 [Deltaproteobacteria bacterium CG07_land_8_20_14_0_80_38_7]|nr:MAG: hypothetical protein COS89_02035 [Deltaproteobacteria bacterium CG07_land_8_20_14_0_80_38_7]